MQKLYKNIAVAAAIFSALAIAAVLAVDIVGHASSSASQFLDWSARELAALETALQAKITPGGHLVPGIRW